LNDVTVVIPSFNDGDLALELVASLPAETQCIVVESGSSDYFEQLPAGVIRLTSPGGRARQMNVGAAAADGDILLFLHADACLDGDAIGQLRRLDPRVVGGCLTLRNSLEYIDDDEVAFAYARRHIGFIPRPVSFWKAVWKVGVRILELRIAWRTHVQKLAYGDQGIFVRREVFERLGGYEDWPVFEDREFFARLTAEGGTRVLPARIIVTPRKSLEVGIINYARFCMQMTRKFKSTDDIAEVEEYRRQLWETYSRRRSREED